MTADRTSTARYLNSSAPHRNPIVLVEGNPMAMREKVSPTGMRAAFTFLALHNRIPVLTAADAAKRPNWFTSSQQAQNGMGMTISETPAEETPATDSDSNGKNGGNGVKPDDPIQLQEYILTAVRRSTRPRRKRCSRNSAACAPSSPPPPRT